MSNPLFYKVIHTLVSLFLDKIFLPWLLCFAGVFIHGVARVLNCGVQAKEYRVSFRTLFLFGIYQVFDAIDSKSALDFDSLIYWREDLFVSLLYS